MSCRPRTLQTTPSAVRGIKDAWAAGRWYPSGARARVISTGKGMRKVLGQTVPTVYTLLGQLPALAHYESSVTSLVGVPGNRCQDPILSVVFVFGCDWRARVLNSENLGSWGGDDGCAPHRHECGCRGASHNMLRVNVGGRGARLGPLPCVISVALRRNPWARQPPGGWRQESRWDIGEPMVQEGRVNGTPRTCRTCDNSWRCSQRAWRLWPGTSASRAGWLGLSSLDQGSGR